MFPVPFVALIAPVLYAPPALQLNNLLAASHTFSTGIAIWVANA
jgi:hypothetical protein